jgi:hypothetical protein
MTLRRLNLKIQGFPESYASEPNGEDMVVGEPHQYPSTTSPPPIQQQQQHQSSPQQPPPQQQQQGDPPLSSSHDPVTGVLGSPIRSSLPRAEDPITGAA